MRQDLEGCSTYASFAPKSNCKEADCLVFTIDVNAFTNVEQTMLMYVHKLT